MRTIFSTGAAVALALAGAAQAATGSGTVDFTFTGFSGAFAWTDPGTENTPADYSVVGTVNGVQPVYNGSFVDRGLFGQEIIGGDAVISGDTATMVRNDFGVSYPNVVSFTPVASFSNVTSGQPFKIGTLSFTNGAWFGGTGNLPVALDFTLTTHSSTPAFNQTLNDAFMMVTNLAPPSESCSTSQGQMDEADFVYQLGAPSMGSLRVFEPFCAPTSSTTQTGSVDLYYEFGSLDPNSMQNVQGDAFLSSSTTPGRLAVPESSTWIMMLAGVGALGLEMRRRRALGTV